MSASVEREPGRISLARAIRAASLRGARSGAVLRGCLGAVGVVGAFIGGAWSTWRPGYTFLEPPAVVLAKLLAYMVAAALIGAAYGAGIGAVVTGVLAALRHRWRRTV